MTIGLAGPKTAKIKVNVTARAKIPLYGRMCATSRLKTDRLMLAFSDTGQIYRKMKAACTLDRVFQWNYIRKEKLFLKMP
jgi:hypothetical protein